METVLTCPLGSVCEEAKDGKIHRCRWLTRMGKFDDNGQAIPGSEYDECAIPLLGLHLTELKKGTLGVQKAVEKRGNAMVDRQDKFLKLAEDTQVRRLNNGH